MMNHQIYFGQQPSFIEYKFINQFIRIYVSYFFYKQYFRGESRICSETFLEKYNGKMRKML